jgi:hypothetical protein
LTAEKVFSRLPEESVLDVSHPGTVDLAAGQACGANHSIKAWVYSKALTFSVAFLEWWGADRWHDVSAGTAFAAASVNGMVRPCSRPSSEW